jgi:hypothetical protein
MTQHQDESVGGLLKSALDDVRDLIREEIALARAEIRQEASKLTTAAVQFGIGGAAIWFAAMFLLFAVALGTATALAWPTWTGFALVAVVLGIMGAVLLMSGRSALRKIRPLPRTIESVKENFR